MHLLARAFPLLSVLAPDDRCNPRYPKGIQAQGEGVMMKGILVAASLMPALWAGPAEVARAAEHYQRTHYREALQVLQPVLGSDPAAYALAGKCEYMTGDFKRAADLFEKAVQLNGFNAEHYHWLGRAYGRRAESGNPLIAPHYASKARQMFERAVEMNPKNGEAVNDLFNYYLEAPGFLGGGLNKAQALLEKIKANDQAEYYYATAQLAQKRQEFHSAEQHLKRAAELAPRQIGRLLDVAKFLARHGRLMESESFITKAEKLDPQNPKLLFDKAETYILARKNLPAAAKLLEQYLRSELKPDMPSRAEAEKLLRQARGGA
jgi:Flp pilus assembly protein TadD